MGSPSFILARKLKALKEDLKKWNKKVFGDLAFRKKCLLSELLGLDARVDLSGPSQEDQTRRIQIKVRFTPCLFGGDLLETKVPDIICEGGGQ